MTNPFWDKKYESDTMARPFKIKKYEIDTMVSPFWDKKYEIDTMASPFYETCSGIIPTLVGTIPLFSRSAGCKKTTEEVVIRKWGRLGPSLSSPKYSKYSKFPQKFQIFQISQNIPLNTNSLLAQSGEDLNQMLWTIFIALWLRTAWMSVYCITFKGSGSEIFDTGPSIKG